MPTSLQTYLALLPLLTLAAADAPPADVPQYSLPVGRKLVYSMSGESKNQDAQGGMTTKGSWQLTVVRENADGTRRVIVRSASIYTQNFGPGQSSSSPERVNLAYADVFPDGRVLPNPSLSMQIELAAALPPLPKDQAQMQKSWSETNDAKLQMTTFQIKKEDGAEFVFSSTVDGVMNKIYAMTQKATYHFDRTKGVITSNESETSQGYGFNTRGTGAVKLESDQIIPAAEITTLAEDFDRFFAASQSYQSLMHQVLKKPDQAEQTLAAAKDLLLKARAAARTPDVTKELTNNLDQHDSYAKYEKESAGRFKDVLNKPAADWATTDVDGKPVKLADFRGKVVVMDFWYRGCGWCMYAMPQVIRLSQDYKDKGVVVLGMNTDRDDKDARFVIDAMGMKYATIKATGIPEKYGVQGFPTLLVVDQEGILRDVHVGYSPTLRVDVAKKIDELLAQTKAGG
jgi:thiol-disulfide isomerase/thioredoxin